MTNKNYLRALWERMIFSFITQSITKTTTYIIKKNFKLKKKYIFYRKKRCGVAKKKADRNTTQPITHVNSIPHTITLSYTKNRLHKIHIPPHYVCFPPLDKKLIDNC
jgi:hypothetical protein